LDFWPENCWYNVFCWNPGLCSLTCVFVFSLLSWLKLLPTHWVILTLSVCIPFHKLTQSSILGPRTWFLALWIAHQATSLDQPSFWTIDQPCGPHNRLQVCLWGLFGTRQFGIAYLFLLAYSVASSCRFKFNWVPSSCFQLIA
jgi:hypothetical protein